MKKDNPNVCDPAEPVPAIQRFEDLVPRQDVTAQLLLLLSRHELDADQERACRALAGQMTDWQEFVAIAARKFSLTYARTHLLRIASDLVPDTIQKRMADTAAATSLSTLRVAAAQLAFHKTCIEPTGAAHAYVKGIALSTQYGAPMGHRYSRDVDVLLHGPDFTKVLNAAAQAGYRFLTLDTYEAIEPNSPDLLFLARYADVVTLLGSRNIPIEVHRRLDKLSLDFDLDLASSMGGLVDVALPGCTVKTLNVPLHFVYACYHHSRHFWSHLHWLADLDGCVRSSECDRKHVNLIADSLGIRPTIDAAYEFHALVSKPDSWTMSDCDRTGGYQFLKACLVNLDGDLDLEVELRRDMNLSDFMSAWQVSQGRQGGFWRKSWIRRLRPSTSQYFENRYPSYLHWVYSVRNASQLAMNGLRLLAASVGRGLGSSRAEPPSAQ